jgi:hemolysin activation/secretion protein
MGAFSPYAFFDTGRATLNARNGQLVAPLATNSRSVAGAGAGVRFRQESWDLDGVVAHQTRGGAAQSELGARATRAWVTVTYRF